MQCDGLGEVVMASQRVNPCQNNDSLGTKVELICNLGFNCITISYLQCDMLGAYI